MAKFSKKERLVASLLSKVPGVKRTVKQLYITVNAVIYHKSYRHKILDNRITNIAVPCQEHETFGGYYDHPTIRNNKIFTYISAFDTKHKPDDSIPIQLAVKDLNTHITTIIGKTCSYNWQQGCRAQWLTDELLIFNDYSENNYNANVYSLSENKIVKTFHHPVQDAYKTDYFLSVNYSRLAQFNPDYGYRNIKSALCNTAADGIWKTDYKTGKTILLHSIQSVTETGHQSLFEQCKHIINHVMISPDGSKFMFIHRYYQGHRRYDRLLLSDFTKLVLLLDENIVSHCHWIDNEKFIGYFRYKGEDGFYVYDLSNGNVEPVREMNNIAFGDGHPTCFRNWIAFDTYPDKSRMQHLFLFNFETQQTIPLLEVCHSLKYQEECRCDLHPRFSDNGKLISFDSVYQGHRTQCMVDISKIQI